VLKLVKLLVFAGLLAAAVYFVPFEGRTLYQRWLDAAPRKARPEARTGARPPRDPVTGKEPTSREPVAGKEPPSRDRPLEKTTDSERKALDKLLEKELADAPKR
jgi:hypothetical protein